MSIAYNILCNTGNTYKDKNGEERENTMNVGRVITTKSGGMMAIIDGLPFAALASKEPIALFFVKPRERTEGNNAPPPATNKSKSASGSGDIPDDIPF